MVSKVLNTVGQLREFLAQYPDDMKLVEKERDEEGTLSPAIQIDCKSIAFFRDEEFGSVDIDTEDSFEENKKYEPTRYTLLNKEQVIIIY